MKWNLSRVNHGSHILMDWGPESPKEPISTYSASVSINTWVNQDSLMNWWIYSTTIIFRSKLLKLNLFSCHNMLWDEFFPKLCLKSSLCHAIFHCLIGSPDTPPCPLSLRTYKMQVKPSDGRCNAKLRRHSPSEPTTHLLQASQHLLEIWWLPYYWISHKGHCGLAHGVALPPEEVGLVILASVIAPQSGLASVLETLHGPCFVWLFVHYGTHVFTKCLLLCQNYSQQCLEPIVKV